MPMKTTPDPTTDAPLFDTGAYAATWAERMQRAIELGPKYYLLDVPRYVRQRQRLGLPLLDWQILWNPTRSFRATPYVRNPPPPQMTEALQLLEVAGVRFDNRRLRVEALAGMWWQARDTPGWVIECGAFRGSVSLLLAVLGRLNGIDKKVLMLDTFEGMPSPSTFDLAREAGEYAPPAGWLDVLEQQVVELGVEDLVEIHQGLFSESFEAMTPRDPTFSFVHIDANIYQGTLEACEFTVPRVSPGGVLVFDDYNGLCDLGARLAIDKVLRPLGLRPLPLAECSAYLQR
jgi:hypothetical protein